LQTSSKPIRTQKTLARGFFDAGIIDELHKEGFVKALWSGK